MKLLVLLSLFFLICITGEAAAAVVFRPAEMRTEYRLIDQTTLNGSSSISRRRLAPYQLCLLCKCCASAETCATMPCCFGIDCQLPNKPYGVCAFVPKTCNCTTCAS